MTRILLGELALLIVAIGAWRWGGKPERIVAGLFVTAATASLALGVPAARFRFFDQAQFTVDLLLFVALLAVACRANRFWPMWMAALELTALGVHGVRVYDAQIVPLVYARLTGQIVYPMLVVLALGTWHFQRRIAAQGRRPSDWSPLRW